MLNCSSTPVMASIAASLAFELFFGGSPARSTPTEGSVYCPSTGSIRSCSGSSMGGRSSCGAVRSTTAGRRAGSGGGGGPGGAAPGGPPAGGRGWRLVAHGLGRLVEGGVVDGRHGPHRAGVHQVVRQRPAAGAAGRRRLGRLLVVRPVLVVVGVLVVGLAQQAVGELAQPLGD